MPIQGAKENVYQVCFKICPWHITSFYLLFSLPFHLFFFFLVGGREWKENKINSEMVFRDFKANKEL